MGVSPKTASSFFVCLQPNLPTKVVVHPASAKAACVFGETGCTPAFVVAREEDMETKRCTCCGLEKPVTDFYKSGIRNGKQGYRTRCIACTLPPATVERWTLREQGRKRCRHCGEIKPFSEFYTDKRKIDGCKHICKACFAVSVNEYRATPKGSAVAYESGKRHRATAKWREAHRLNVRRVRAEKRYVQQERARKYVWDKILRNGFPRPTDCVCADCGVQATQSNPEVSKGNTG